MCNHFKRVFWVNALFSLFYCQHMRHKLCTQFSFFQIIRQNTVNDGFRYHRSSFITAATQAMFSFVLVVPSLPLHSLSSINSPPAENWLCYWNIVVHDTDGSPNASTNISHIFAAVNPALQQNFITACCSEFSSMVIYNTSRYRTYNIAKHFYTAAYGRIDFKLGTWGEKGLSNNFPNFYNDCATSLDFRGTVSRLLGHTVYTLTFNLRALSLYLLFSFASYSVGNLIFWSAFGLLNRSYFELFSFTESLLKK